MLGGEAEVIELKDFKTKLYFHSPISDPIDENLFTSVYPEGIVYFRLYPEYWNQYQVWFIYNLPNHTTRVNKYGPICNFPDYAVNWNRKNQNTEIVPDSGITAEDTIDIIINGKIHCSDVQIYGTLELISLKKQVEIE
jgi:hypothetical protein